MSVIGRVVKEMGLVLYFEDGTRLVGNWKDDNFHVGEYIANSGVIMSGLWDNEYLSEGYMKTEDGRIFRDI